MGLAALRVYVNELMLSFWKHIFVRWLFKRSLIVLTTMSRLSDVSIHGVFNESLLLTLQLRKNQPPWSDGHGSRKCCVARRT